ncbi:hypothetical protein QUC31_006297 [Theobroma cacao]
MLNIENCENVEKEILIEGLANEEMIRQRLFRRLEFLLLKDLPKLTRFCHGNYLEFPLLRTLRIESCPTLKTFISDAEGNSSEIAFPTLFNEKVILQYLFSLYHYLLFHIFVLKYLIPLFLLQHFFSLYPYLLFHIFFP